MEQGLLPSGAWNSSSTGNHATLGDRPSDLREEEQPYYMRSPFNAPNPQQNDLGGAPNLRAVSPFRNQAAAHYGLHMYAQAAGLSPRGKITSRPGTSLGGGIGIRKLSKLDAKEQDDVHEVTEDEDRVTSPLLPPS